MTHTQIIDIIQAHAKGKELEFNPIPHSTWLPMNTPTSLERLLELILRGDDIRIKPTPKLRPIRVEELPYVFGVKHCASTAIPIFGCYLRGMVRQEWVLDWIESRTTYTTNGVGWNSFEVEDK